MDDNVSCGFVVLVGSRRFGVPPEIEAQGGAAVEAFLARQPEYSAAMKISAGGSAGAERSKPASPAGGEL